MGLLNSQYAALSQEVSISKPSGDQTYDTLEYPTNLGDARYPHYVMFYINENTKSTIGKQASVPGNGYDRDLTKTQGNGIGNLASGIQKAANNSTGITKEAVDLLHVDRWVSSYKRLNYAIALQMPHSVQASYAMTYDEAQMGLLGSFLNDIASGKGVENASKAAIQGIIQNIPQHLGAIVGSVAGGLVGKVVGGSAGGAVAGGIIGEVNSNNFQTLVQKAQGMAKNSHQEQVFRHVNYRHFQFDYMFAPRNDTESQTIQAIIQLFKTHMHPELNTDANLGGANFLVMPAEFDIEYYYGGEENVYVNKIATCALTNLSVNYTPMSQWSAFKGSGVPVMTSLSLQFTELEPILRNMIQQGY